MKILTIIELEHGKEGVKMLKRILKSIFNIIETIVGFILISFIMHSKFICTIIISCAVLIVLVK